jgi:hypothetical protein
MLNMVEFPIVVYWNSVLLVMHVSCPNGYVCSICAISLVLIFVMFVAQMMDHLLLEDGKWVNLRLRELPKATKATFQALKWSFGQLPNPKNTYE